MKGIVFNLLEAVVRREHGDDTWDALLEAAQLDGVYTSLGNYPDEHLFRLVGAASAALKLPPEAIVRWFGRQATPLFAQRYPQFFAVHRATRPFLLTINSLIHPEVRKLYPGADTPDFDFDTSSPDVLVMGYRSKRKLCAFALGLMEGAADHYGEVAGFEHPRCMHRGDPACEIRITFQPQPAQP